MSAMQAAKGLLRKELKNKIKCLNTEEMIRQSEMIVEKLFALDCYKNSQSVSVYLSMPNEVNTSTILDDIFSQNKNCYIPRYTSNDMEMVALKDQKDYDDLPLTKWNIKQPKIDETRLCAIKDGALDLIIVPGLGFTSSGYRLGRGKGYYDNYVHKYEKEMKKKPVLIGLAFDCQIVDDIPTDAHDVKLDIVLHSNYN